MAPHTLTLTIHAQAVLIHGEFFLFANLEVPATTPYPAGRFAYDQFHISSASTYPMQTFPEGRNDNVNFMTYLHQDGTTSGAQAVTELRAAWDRRIVRPGA